MTVREKFNFLLEENNLNKINDFCLLHSVSATLQDIIYMVDNGADPHYKNDSMLIQVASSHEKETLLYLINQCGVDINAQNGKALVESIYNKNKSVMIFLLDSGIYISDDAIDLAIHYNDHRYVETLIKYGVPIERIGDIFWKKYLVDYDFIINKIHLMTKNGLDVNQSIVNYFRQNKN
jgi:hypothetical protein